ncbi:Transcription factor HES-1 [Cricetulus griseus]|uniref:Transcription factor HES-1 n=1 Tax=Cricetulus griseus TaxID=10029 RepID=G3HWY8_CRIGR|nr:Transcription factor HES-1 [Cricetulus griseus]
MPADIMEKNSSSPVAATPASVNTTPDKPKTASEHRKSSRHSKLEKADILEMTVKHLRNLQRAQMTGHAILLLQPRSPPPHPRSLDYQPVPCH